MKASIQHRGQVTAVRVSVVIPAFNAGEYLEACVRSVVEQSLDPDFYEVIFVNDGSTDGTGERLDAVAAEHPHVRVLHTPPSGGPGRPRNVGLDAARGEYVYFLDCDDWLGPEALERMHAMAVRNNSDILIGRMVGVGGRGVPRAIFAKSRDKAEILRDHLLSMLTPHKLFRTDFLRKHEIRFPEGPVRLEDHRFCMPAYFKAEVISVLADYPCCYWVKREDDGNYSANRFDPEEYYGSLREVLDIVDENVPEGPERDRYYAHWLRGKLLKRMGSGTLLFYQPDYRERLFTAVRELMLERFSPSVEKYLTRNMRLRAALVRAGAYEDLVKLAEVERRIGPRPVLDEWRQDGLTASVTVSAELVDRATGPVEFRRDGDRIYWDMPAELTTPLEPMDVTDLLPKSRLEIMIKHRRTGEEVVLPTTSELAEGEGVALTAVARLDPATADHGGPLRSGGWNLRVRLNSCGWTADRRVPGGRIRITQAGAARQYKKPAPPPSRLRRVVRKLRRMLR
jgi:poly(ribitol-phosphate) beta-N-acetylglucosaminyltransferase